MVSFSPFLCLMPYDEQVSATYAIKATRLQRCRGEDTFSRVQGQVGATGAARGVRFWSNVLNRKLNRTRVTFFKIRRIGELHMLLILDAFP